MQQDLFKCFQYELYGSTFNCSFVFLKGILKIFVLTLGVISNV